MDTIHLSFTVRLCYWKRAVSVLSGRDAVSCIIFWEKVDHILTGV